MKADAVISFIMTVVTIVCIGYVEAAVLASGVVILSRFAGARGFSINIR
jgi:hypothetical protein